MKTSVINQIKTLLGMEVNLETMKLMDGITIFEADAFEMDKEVFIVTEDEQKIPVPIGEYELEDGRILVVEVEGIILEIKEVATEEEVVEEEAPEVEVEVEAEATPTAKKTIESIVKETFFAEIEKLTQEASFFSCAVLRANSSCKIYFSFIANKSASCPSAFNFCKVS